MIRSDAMPAVLALEDGRVFRGRSAGAPGLVTGEVVFTTAMTGYQEVLSDPSYAGQIINFTYPLIGNVGVNMDDMEAAVPHCSGLVTRRMSRVASNHRAEATLASWLVEHGLIAIDDVDTRALTLHIRRSGAMRAALYAGEDAGDGSALVAEARRAPHMSGRDLTGLVARSGPVRVTHTGEEIDCSDLELSPELFTPGSGPRVVVLDFGVKRGILRQLATAGARTIVVPGRTAVAEVLALEPDGVLLSNGPGDPAATEYAVDTTRALLGRVPMLGICLGHQLLALALGLRTEKLPFGHHGANHPVRDHDGERVLVTSQNHGFAVLADDLPAGVRITYTSLVDGTVEGLVAPEHRARSVQFHPEASPGPHDARSILQDFIDELPATPSRAADSSTGSRAPHAATH